MMGASSQLRCWAVLLTSLCTLTAGPAWADEPDLLSRGKQLLEQGRIQAAGETLYEAAIQEPRSGEVHFALGRVAAAAGQSDDALIEFERSRALGFATAELFTELGTAYQSAGRYEEALEALELAVELRPDDARVRLFLGLARLGLDDASGAAEEFERVGDYPAGFRQIALYNLGIAHLRGREQLAARRSLIAATRLDPESVTGRRAAALLAETRPTAVAAPSRRWDLSGSAGAFYDDNVTSSENDVSTNVGDGGVAFELAGAYRLLDSPSLRVETGYDFYQSAYFDLDDFNQQIHGVGIDASRSFGEADAGISYRYNLSLLGNDFLLGLHEVRSRLAFSPRPGWYAVAWPRFRAKHHEDSRRSSIQGAIGTDQFFFIGDGGTYALLGLSFETEDAEGAEFDYLGFSGRTGIRRPFKLLGGNYRAEIDYRFQLRNYTNVTPSIGSKRRDRVHAGRFRLVRNLTEEIEMHLDYDLVGSDSNLPSIDYLQNVVTLSIGFAL
jgi:tetratricopeptide (TPR) repeat protein